MTLKEAYIENFGKLHKQTVTFAPGINVICGENEAGKSTLQEFITAMLFGMEPKRGRNPENDTYRRYEPWNAASYYCGKLRFEVDGRPFALTRNFYHREKQAKLWNEADGEQLSVEFGDLSMLLGELSRSTYQNTWCVGQSGAVTGAALADSLQEYLANLENTGDATIRFSLAQKKLEQRGRQIRKEKKALLQEKEKYLENLRVEERILAEDMQKLSEQFKREKVRHDLAMQELMRKEKEAEQEIQKNKQETGGRGDRKAKGGGRTKPYLAAAVICGTAAVLHLFLFGKYSALAWRAAEAVLLVLTLVNAWLGHRYELPLDLKKVQAEQKEQNGRMVLSEEVRKYIRLQQEEMQRHQALEHALAEQLDDKELRRSNARDALEEMMLKSSSEVQAEQREQAFLLAQQTLQKLSGGMSGEAKRELHDAASGIFSEITGGRYEQLVFDDAMRIFVFDGAEKIPVHALSRGTVEQVYLAVRIALGRVLSGEPMFFSFDEAFAFYDEERLASVLGYLGRQPVQSLIFSCTAREQEILEKNNIPYHRIVLKTEGGI